MPPAAPPAAAPPTAAAPAPPPPQPNAAALTALSSHGALGTVPPRKPSPVTLLPPLESLSPPLPFAPPTGSPAPFTPFAQCPVYPTRPIVLAVPAPPLVPAQLQQQDVLMLTLEQMMEDEAVASLLGPR